MFHCSVDFTLELVGSCCTLVAEKLLNDVTFDLDPLVAHLLLGMSHHVTSCDMSQSTARTHCVFSL